MNREHIDKIKRGTRARVDNEWFEKTVESWMTDGVRMYEKKRKESKNLGRNSQEISIRKTTVISRDGIGSRTIVLNEISNVKMLIEDRCKRRGYIYYIWSLVTITTE